MQRCTRRLWLAEGCQWLIDNKYLPTRSRKCDGGRGGSPLLLIAGSECTSAEVTAKVGGRY